MPCSYLLIDRLIATLGREYLGIRHVLEPLGSAARARPIRHAKAATAKFEGTVASDLKVADGAGLANFLGRSRITALAFPKADADD